MTTPTPTPTHPIVFLDLTLGTEPLGRIKLQLDTISAPRAAENFRSFCTGETRDHLGRPIGYKNSKFHRVVKGFMVQGGDFVHGDGTGRASIYGVEGFADEKGGLEGRHAEAGVLSMANSGKNTNGCQFFITCAPAPHLDGKHVVFGKVVEGLDVVKKVENVRLQGERPRPDVIVAQCGEM